MYAFVPKRCATSHKIMYHDRVKALQAADAIQIERGTMLWTYRCEYCGTWHLSHHDPDARRITIAYSRVSKKPTSRKRGYKPRRR
ncbi:MAG: hypothetical protein Q3961_00705 [Bifidobacteriaceae bacterium]|nr:hypothetical protein [Bifidobacteriaceae bacterium]